ncbi:hypothetical protein ACFXKY_15370 [Streptomyces canus]
MASVAREAGVGKATFGRPFATWGDSSTRLRRPDGHLR